MARYFVPESMIVTDEDGHSHRIHAGVTEVADDFAAHEDAQKRGVKPESEMNDEDRAHVARLNELAKTQVGMMGLVDNRPESDVNRTSAADARDLAHAPPGTPPHEVGIPKEDQTPDAYGHEAVTRAYQENMSREYITTSRAPVPAAPAATITPSGAASRALPAAGPGQAGQMVGGDAAAAAGAVASGGLGSGSGASKGSSEGSGSKSGGTLPTGGSKK